MNYLNPELLRRLAAEYSLGTLRGPARKRFESVLDAEPEAREHVNFWDWRLSEFGQAIDPVAPPSSARDELLAYLARSGAFAGAASPCMSAPRHALVTPSASRRVRRAAWRLLASMATAAGLLLAFQIGHYYHSAASLQARATDSYKLAPIYVAQLGMPASSMQWLISLSPDRKKLMVVADDDFLSLGRFTVQLWGSTAATGPVRLGALPVTRDGLVAIPLPEALKGEDHTTFAITLEPNGASSRDRPSGPILGTAQNLDAI